jgi:two-component system sensor histidine kinase UhpB
VLATIPTPPRSNDDPGDSGVEPRDPVHGRPYRYVPLFWRLFVPNAVVLIAAGVLLTLQPPNGRVPILAAGVAVMSLVNLLLMRRAFAPLARLVLLMRGIDPLEPGRRLPVDGPESEVSLLSRTFNEMLDRLEWERRESARRNLAAQEDERRRLVAELHDELGQTLTALLLTVQRAGNEAPAEMRDPLLQARALARHSIEHTRRLARQLRPEALDELGLVPAVDNLAQKVTDGTGLRVTQQIEAPLPRLGPDAELVVYRVAQESLTNVVRHAHASQAQVRLGTDGETLVLTVADDGVGLQAPSKGDGGLRLMRERALLIGAELRFRRSTLGGTEVRLRVPLQVAGH